MIGNYGHVNSLAKKKPTTLSGGRHWVADKKRNGTQRSSARGLLTEITRIEALLTDDRQNPGCRYSRDGNGQGLDQLKAIPSCNVFV